MAVIQLGPDLETLIISTRKPVENLKYEFDSDPQKVRKMMLENKDQNQASEVQDDVFEENQSNATCKISEIQSILYGGHSSRFWMLRKLTNNMESQDLDNLPFFSWNCLTLCLENRDIDLVIHDEAEMVKILKFLIYKLNTVDGVAGSADKILRKMNHYKASQKQKMINLHDLNRKVMLKYKIMKIRAKISFMALKSQKTIVELLVDQILKTHKDLLDLGHIRPACCHGEEIFKAINRGEQKIMSKIVMLGKKQCRNYTQADICKALSRSEDIIKVQVVKNGKIEYKTLDVAENGVKEGQIKNLLQIDSCFDIFRDLDKKANLFQ